MSPRRDADRAGERVRTVTLLGSDYPNLGEVATASLAPATGLALSRGRYPKSYAHLDPNEDAAFAAWGSQGSLALVADGHNGFDAALAAVLAARQLAEEALAGEGLAEAHDLETVVGRLASRIANGVARKVDGAPADRRHSRTALTAILMLPGGTAIVHAGDTAALRIRSGRPRRLTKPRPFIGRDEGAPGTQSLRTRAGDRLVLASDGIVDYLGQNSTAAVARLAATGSPEAAGRALVEAAMAGGAGDHLAAVVVDVR
ncbi:MAG: SpoIIE family protein phosphatase [Euzebyales bacterium]|nr:SpoIIE family protein phosphatase [Euzebyales bacterium]